MDTGPTIADRICSCTLARDATMGLNEIKIKTHTCIGCSKKRHSRTVSVLPRHPILPTPHFQDLIPTLQKDPGQYGDRVQAFFLIRQHSNRPSLAASAEVPVGR